MSSLEEQIRRVADHAIAALDDGSAVEPVEVATITDHPARRRWRLVGVTALALVACALVVIVLTSVGSERRELEPGLSAAATTVPSPTTAAPVTTAPDGTVAASTPPASTPTDWHDLPRVPDDLVAIPLPEIGTVDLGLIDGTQWTIERTQAALCVVRGTDGASCKYYSPGVTTTSAVRANWAREGATPQDLQNGRYWLIADNVSISVVDSEVTPLCDGGPTRTDAYPGVALWTCTVVGTVDFSETATIYTVDGVEYVEGPLGPPNAWCSWSAAELQQEGAAGTYYTTLAITNTSDTACVVPTVAGVTATVGGVVTVGSPGGPVDSVPPDEATVDSGGHVEVVLATNTSADVCGAPSSIQASSVEVSLSDGTTVAADLPSTIDVACGLHYSQAGHWL